MVGRSGSYTLRTLFTLTTLVGVFLMIGVWSVNSGVGTPADSNTCTNQLKMLALALQNYHDVFNRYPPAYIADEDGRPMHSWRVLVLPFLEETVAYLKYDFQQPWNSPHNQQVIATVAGDQFCCPSSQGKTGETNYVAAVGPDTVWSGAKGFRLGDINDGPAQTILLIEVKESGIHWAEPRDWPAEWALQGVNPEHSTGGISSGHRRGAHVVMCDGRVRFLPNALNQTDLQALLTPTGGESVNLPND